MSSRPIAAVVERRSRRMPFLAATLALTACSSPVTPSNMSQIKLGMTNSQVEAILGRPTHIDQSETTDQTINGEVDHYPAPNGEGRVIFVNHAVFKAEFVSGAKS
jgi:SmpA / OmlA family